MKLIAVALVVSAPALAAAEVHRHAGSADVLPLHRAHRVPRGAAVASRTVEMVTAHLGR